MKTGRKRKENGHRLCASEVQDIIQIFLYPAILWIKLPMFQIQQLLEEVNSPHVFLPYLLVFDSVIHILLYHPSNTHT